MGWRDDPVAATGGNAWQHDPVEGAAPAPVPAAQQNATTTAHPGGYGALDLAGSKFTFGLADKVAALGAAAGSMTNDLFHGRPVRNFSPSYDAALASETAQKTAYQQAHPTVNTLTSPLGLLAGGAANTGLSAVRAGLLSGAVAGGAQAAGSARGDAVQQTGQIALGAGLGAATGGIAGRVLPGLISRTTAATLPPIARAAQFVAPGSKFAQSTARATAALPTGDAAKAQAYIVDRLAADGTEPAALASQMTTAQNAGTPFAPMDSGPAMQRAAASIARKSGPGSKIVTDAVATRQAGQGERIQSAIGDGLGPTVGVATASQDLQDSAAAAAAPLYDAAHPQIVDDPSINMLMKHPEMQSALTAGKQMHADDSFMANVRGEQPPSPLPTDGFDVRTLDYSKRALDRKIGAAYSGDAQAKMQLPILKDLRSTLLNKLDAASPEYAAARAAYAGPMQSAEALQAGKAAVNKSGDDIAAETSRMTPSEVDQYRLGHRSALSDMIDAKVDGADKVRAMIGSPKRRAALEQLYGGSNGLARLQGSLDNEAAMSTTYQRVTGNSKTAENTLDDANLAGAAQTARSLLHGLHGNFGPALTHLYTTASDKIGGEAGQRLRTQIAGLITQPDPTLLSGALGKAAARKQAVGILAQRVSPLIGAGAGRGSVGLLGSVQN